MNHDGLTYVSKRILQSMKKGEACITRVKHSIVLERDQELLRRFSIEGETNFVVKIALHELIVIEDWFRDGNTFKRLMQKGKGTGSPFINSAVYLKLRVSRSRTVMLEEGAEGEAKEEEEVLYDNFEAEKDPLEFVMDLYELPPIVRKVLKSMKKREISEITST